MEKTARMFVRLEKGTTVVVSEISESSPYYKVIWDAAHFLTKRFPITICFAGLVGSIGYELGNATSDYDVVVFYESKDREEREEIHTSFVDDIEMNNAHFKCVDMEALILDKGDGTKYCCLPNYLRLHENFDYDMLPGKRNCKVRSVITETLFCQKLFDKNNYLKNNLSALSSQLTIYDFIKRQYISAQGRLTRYMNGEQARLRSYLYTARDLFAVEHILTNKEFPPLDFLELTARCSDGSVRDKLREMYHINKADIRKEELIIKPIERLNLYFFEKLNTLRPKIINYYAHGRTDVFDIKIYHGDASLPPGSYGKL